VQTRPSGQVVYYGWGHAWYISTLYNHVAPPNWKHFDCGQESGYDDVPNEHAVVTARSHHPGGVHTLQGDGSVRFVKESINLSVWRALGSRNGGEAISADSF
jgi:hypothetical protein